MAIIYSYPHATPAVNDMVLGAKFKENEGISTNSFYISDLVTLISAEIPGIPGSEGPQGPAGTTGSQGIQGPQGDQGIQGLAGTVGPAGLEWQGTWESGTSYAADDAVAYDGASWFCILATSGTTPPDVDTTHWALLAAQGAQGLQGIQGIQGIQGPVGATGTQGIQGVQGLPGAAATQTLQQTVDLGNTISGTQGGINFTTTLTNTSIKVGESTISGMYLNTTQLICEKNNGNDLIVLQFPTVYSGVNQITLPSATGTVALTSDITLQKAYTGGNTIVSGNFKTGVFDSINGISVENTSSLSKTTLETTKITLTKNASGLKTTNILQAVTPTSNRTIYFPDADGTIALTSDITQQKTTSFTAVNDQYYSTNGTLTVTDPTGSTNRGYIVHVVGGTSTISGVGYTVGALVYRYYNGSSWISTNVANPTPAYTKYVCNFNAFPGAPVATVLENTIGNIVWTRNGVGDYRGTLSGAFPDVTKTWFLKPNTQYDAGNYGAFLSRISANVVQLLTTDYDQITPVDGAYNTSFEIRVYP